MGKRDFFIIIVLFFAGILLRAPLVEKMQSHWDGPQYSIAILHYSFEDETPAPLGYPLYIGMARLFYYIVADPHKALLMVSVLFSCIGAIVFYLAGKTIFNRVAGIISSCIFLSGSTYYYFGLTAYAYIVTVVVTTALATIVYLITIKKKDIGFIFGLVFALALGIRPQEIGFMTPLVLLGFFMLKAKQKKYAILSFLFFFLLWFIPFMHLVGGVFKYIMVSTNFLRSGIYHPSISSSLKYSELIFKGYWLSFGIAGFFLISYFKVFVDKLKNKKIIKDVLLDKKTFFFSLWLLPSFMVNLIVVTQHAGYQMFYLSGLTILLSYAVWKTFQNKKFTLIGTILLIVVANLLVFFVDRDPGYNKPYRPTSFHYSDIRKNDLKLSSKVDYINKNFNSKSTLLIATPTLWRPIMYHFKNYLIYEFDALATDNPDFKNIRRDAINWKYQQYYVSKYEFIIPDKINTVVVLDDEINFKYSNINKVDINIIKGSRITYFKVKPHDKFSYNLGFIKKI